MTVPAVASTLRRTERRRIQVRRPWAPTALAGGTIALSRKFSASRFIDECRGYGATYFTYVGKALGYLPDGKTLKLDPGRAPLVRLEQGGRVAAARPPRTEDRVRGGRWSARRELAVELPAVRGRLERGEGPGPGDGEQSDGEPASEHAGDRSRRRLRMVIPSLIQTSFQVARNRRTAAPLGQPRHAALEGVAVQVRQAGHQRVDAIVGRLGRDPWRHGHDRAVVELSHQVDVAERGRQHALYVVPTIRHAIHSPDENQASIAMTASGIIGM